VTVGKLWFSGRYLLRSVDSPPPKTTLMAEDLKEIFMSKKPPFHADHVGSLLRPACNAGLRQI
jgi:hypothetical protein